jgi:NifB/MoaA-like Fe-S oxidoreductase
VCPGVNDGDVLDDTLAGVLDHYPELASVAVVPLGLSRFNTEPAMRLHTAAEAGRVVEIVERWQATYGDLLGRRMVFAADEYYLMTNRPFPPAEHYEGFPMHEDGIGMARTFELEFEGRAKTATGVRSGFFAAVDTPVPMPTRLPSNPAAYTGLRSRSNCVSDPGLYPRDRSHVATRTAVLTGEFGARVIEPLIARLSRPDVRVLPVANEFFGGNTGVTGLMTGTDLTRVLAAEPTGDRYLLPDVCLSDDGRFLDGLTVAELPRAVEVVATDGIALRRALGAAA